VRRHNVQTQLDTSQHERLDFEAAAAESHRRARALDGSLAIRKVDRTGHWVDAQPHQQALAAVAGALGLLSICGPSTFTRLFLAIAGSSVGGLMVASSVAVAKMELKGQGAQSVLISDEALVILGGGGTIIGYSIWGTVVLIGVLRWILQCDRRPHEVYWPKRGRIVTAPAAPPLQQRPRGAAQGGLPPAPRPPQHNNGNRAHGASLQSDNSARLPPLPPAPPISGAPRR